MIRAGRSIRERLERLIGQMEAQIMGPTPLNVVKVNNRFRYRVHISCRAGSTVRALISQAVIECSTDKQFRGVSVFAENDPLS